jgi:hypothetical protein
MSVTTETILNTTIHGTPSGNYDGSSQDWFSDAVRAANYYRGRSGLQTVLFRVSGFEGEIVLEATLNAVPETADWFTAFTYGDGSTTPLTDYHPETVIGNFTWIRLRITGFSGGTIDSVTLSY